MNRKLYVYLNQNDVGDLFEKNGKFFEFHYKENAEAISLAMPLNTFAVSDTFVHFYSVVN